MNIFICWSGARSKVIAAAIRDLLTPVLRLEGQEPFLSEDIEKGVSWFEQVIAQLRTAGAGIICLTPENASSPWLHFEAGALASRMAVLDDGTEGAADRGSGAPVYTLLHDIEPGQLEGPLSSYHGTTTTRKDVGALISSLAARQGGDQTSWQERLDAHWPTFEKKLAGAKVRLEELIPDFQTLFQRKAFNEPLRQCANQHWIERYEAARETSHRLSASARLVGAACPRYQVDLFQEIREQVDGYAMEMSAKLMEMKRFEVGNDGDLVIEPRVGSACERRRLNVRTLVRRTIDAAEVPLTDDAFQYLTASTFDQRKLLVHRLENRIREIVDRASEEPTGPDATRLGSASELQRYRESSWDLDRIYYYLVMEYGGPTSTRQAEYAARDVELELERLRAQPAAGSLTPTHYALGALKVSIQAGVDPAVQAAVERTLADVVSYIEASAERDAGGQVRRTVGEIQSLLSAH